MGYIGLKVRFLAGASRAWGKFEVWHQCVGARL